MNEILSYRTLNQDLTNQQAATAADLLHIILTILSNLDSHRAHFLAHLSRRLTGELIGYPWIWRPSSVRPFTFSNIFSSETAWPIKAKFYVEPPWEGGTKVYIHGPGHMTKMAATPIYGKNLKKSSSPEPAGRFLRNLVCSIWDSCPS